MKTQMEMRLECLKLAATLGTSKTIPSRDVIPYAMEFYRWVDGKEDEKSSSQDARRLMEAYAR